MCEKPENTGIKKKINSPLIVISWWVINISKVPSNNKNTKLSLEKIDI